MISRLSGKIVDTSDKYIVIDVNGVGYQVFVSVATLAEIQGSPSTHSTSSGQVSSGHKEMSDISLWTHLSVRENALELFGFLDKDELQFFQLLIDISGIGPRSALTIISVAPIDILKRAIGSGDISYLTKISGIGKKTAEKIVIELRDKLSALGHRSEDGEHKGELDALEALKSLGYSQNEARDVLKEIPSEIMGTSARIKEALKILGSK